jgi:dienelactone hydrolase
MWLWIWLACSPSSKVSEVKPGASKPAMWPFPSAHLVVDGGLSIPADEVPVSIGVGTPLPLERLHLRSGFSVVQSSVIDLGVAIDPASLPGQSEARVDGSVQIWDLDTGLAVRCFAEVDATPELDGEIPVLIVRPLDRLTPGHRVAIAVTTAVLTTDGEPLEPLDWYQDLLDDRPGPGLEDWVGHYQQLSADLTELGAGELALAFDFPVVDAGQSVRDLVAGVSVPTEWTIEEVRDIDEGAHMPPGGWRSLSGSFINTNWLVDEVSLELDSSGVPQVQGEIEARFFVHIPESVRGREPGTVPVWIFGHGIFGSPEEYLKDLDDVSTVAQLADEAGVIMVGTVWRGLEGTDRVHAIQMADDFGRLPEITDRLHQGVADVTALKRLLLEGTLLDAPELEGLPDKSRLGYYGISLGGIAGAVMVANNPELDAAVLHVGGGAWSTMLERSSQWIPFDWIMAEQVPSARDRQLLYALSQLYWDPVDPANHVDGLVGRSIIWQESMGDEQVANMTTELIARAVGARLLLPAAAEVPGLETTTGPAHGGPILVQLDPELPYPAEANRPGTPTLAHSIPRRWAGTHQQIIRFLDQDDPGVVEHYCGPEVCSASNPGE